MKKVVLLAALLCYGAASANYPLNLTNSIHVTDSTDLKNGTVKGIIIDKDLQQSVAYAAVVIKSGDGKETVTGGITNEDGTFEIKGLAVGKYIFEVQFIGYKTYSQPIEITKKQRKLDVGTIYLEENTEELDGVEVVAERTTIEQRVDRKVINVGKDLITSGPTAADIMANLPSISVDQQSGNISMRGNENVRVMVDGKLSNIPAAQLLKQIPSASIKSIELITNPSAKYNPEGMSGIINIILHKNTMVGFNGNINVGLTYEKEAKFNSSIDMNYRNGKFNLYGNYGNNIAKNKNGGYVLRPTDRVDQIFNFLDNRKSHLFKVGLDFYLNDKNTLSVFTNQNISESTMNGNTQLIFHNDIAKNEIQNFINGNDNLSSQYNFDYKLDLEKDGHNIELEVDYNVYDGEQPTDYTYSRGFVDLTNPNYNTTIDTDRKRLTVNLDYVNPLTDKTKLELGVQARLFNSFIDFDTNKYPYKLATTFDYTRDIYSAYATYSKKYEKWTYQLGARVENVTVDAIPVENNVTNDTTTSEPFSNEYVEVYPSAFFTYTPSDKNSYNLSYSRRVDRPGIGQVNPIPEWSTPLITSSGNIALEPQFTNSLEVNYTRRLEKGSITSGVFYRAISNEINRVLFEIEGVDSDKKEILLSHDNFDNTTAYGVELSGRYKLASWWNFNASFDFYSQKQTGVSKKIDALGNTIETTKGSVNNAAYNFRMFNNFKVSKTVSLSAFGFYRGANKSLQFNIKPMYFVNVGARVNFAQGRGTFSLNFNDIFNTMKFSFDSDRPFDQVGQFNWESHTISTSLSYRFGGNKYRAKSRKRRDNDEKQGGGGLF